MFDTLGDDIKVDPSSVVLQDFGGGTCTVKGEVKLPIIVDGIAIDVKAVIADCDLFGADLLLGQPALATPGVTLTVTDGKAKLTRVDPAVEMIQQITLEDDKAMALRKVLCLEDTSMDPGEEADLLVVVYGGKQGEKYWVPVKRFEKKGTVLAIGGQVLTGGESSKLHVKNVGEKQMIWKTGCVMARCTLIGEVTVKVGQISSNSLFKLDWNTIRLGDIGKDNVHKLHALLEKLAVCFSVGDDDLGVTILGEMRIQLTTDKPVVYRSYRLSFPERVIVREKAQD